MGGQGAVHDQAVAYLRIAALGAPAFMLASAGQGFLRGTGDLRTPLYILIVLDAIAIAGQIVIAGCSEAAPRVSRTRRAPDDRPARS